LSALAYAFWLRGQWPEPLTLLGMALLVTGVITGVRVKSVAKAPHHPPKKG